MLSKEEKNESNEQNINIDKNKESKAKLYLSVIAEVNPIFMQLINFGYDKIYSRRVIYYFHPGDIEEALNYMSEINGIIQHRFVQNRRDLSCKFCYICGDDEKHHLKELNVNRTNINNNDNKINNKNDKEEEKIVYKNQNNNININNLKKNNNNDEEKKSNYSLGNYYLKESNSKINKSNSEDLEMGEEKDKKVNNENNSSVKNSIKFSHNSDITNEHINESDKVGNNQKIKEICQVCEEEFIVTDKNKIKNCGHAFCEECWVYSLSITIKENKIPTIKCLNHKCQGKLEDEFIINLLDNNKDLIKLYKRYKLELLVINDPNKKFCPYPNCDSYLELKDINTKDAKCLNNHIYCFFCLKKPHGNLPCDKTSLDDSVAEFAKNNFVKRCPNCSIITEKIVVVIV